MVIMTIALPISFAFLDSGFLFGLILSMVVSIAVFISSAIRMNGRDVNIIILKIGGKSKKH